MAWPQSRIEGRRVYGIYFELGLQLSVPPSNSVLGGIVPFDKRVKAVGWN